jgi:DNA-binding CsgD family transcriptional regulator
MLAVSESVVTRFEGDAPALVVANSAHEIIFATPMARDWFGQFFRADDAADLLPGRIRHWLESRTSKAAREFRVRTNGASLTIRKYAPQPADCVVFYLQLGDDDAAGPSANERLSDRERDVLRWVASGKSNKAIASVLKISPKTVGKHVENVFRKLGVTSRVAAANAFTGYTADRD